MSHEPRWMMLVRIPIYIILLPLILIHLILFRVENCSKCYKKIWRFQKSVREEKPFICEGENYPTKSVWHFKCYIKKKK